MYFSHMHFQVVSSFKNLSALAARVRYKSTLMLMADMSEQSAFKVETSRTFRTSKLHSALCRLAKCVNIVLLGIVQPFQPWNGIRTRARWCRVC